MMPDRNYAVAGRENCQRSVLYTVLSAVCSVRARYDDDGESGGEGNDSSGRDD